MRSKEITQTDQRSQREREEEIERDQDQADQPSGKQQTRTLAPSRALSKPICSCICICISPLCVCVSFGCCRLLRAKKGSVWGTACERFQIVSSVKINFMAHYRQTRPLGQLPAPTSLSHSPCLSSGPTLAATRLSCPFA